MRLPELLIGAAMSASAVSATSPVTTAPRIGVPVSTDATDADDAGSGVRKLIDEVSIPFDSFTLPNGLRVVVVSDKKVPSVYVGVFYDVGSKHEALGRSGFAHLFEHVMFNGSQNVPGSFLPPLMSVGALVNGSTSKDRTNYYEVVPTGALERALFMESDRMGYLLGALTQEALDRERAVVKNEKREVSSSATSIVSYMTRKAIYPVGHPYGRSVIGSMKGLDAASLDDVKRFFKAHYGPNNAVLVLAGDIDVITAKTLVTRYFGSIPAGPLNVRPQAGPVTLARTIRESVTAPITSPEILRVWPVPGPGHPDGRALSLLADLYAGGQELPIARRLVRERRMFQNVAVLSTTLDQAGEFAIQGRVQPGIDPNVAAAALDREIAALLAGTVPMEAIDRQIASHAYGYVQRLEDPVTRGLILGEAALSEGSPERYKAKLLGYAAHTPASVMAAARRWLMRPRYELTVMPGPRVTPPDDVEGERSPAAAAATTSSSTTERPAPALAEEKRPALPDVGPARDSHFPSIEHARLNNGISVSYVRESSIPFTSMIMDIEGGVLSATADEAVVMSLMYRMLASGYGGRDEEAINRQNKVRGLSLSGGALQTGAAINFEVPNANLAYGLDRMYAMLTTPVFPADELARNKRDWLASREEMRLDETALIGHAVLPLMDAGSPYNRLDMDGGSGAIRRLERSDIVAAFDRWLRPEAAAIRIVSSKPLSELMPMLNRTIGRWRPRGQAAPLPRIAYTPRWGEPRIVLIDLPGATQATVVAGQALSMSDRDPGEAAQIANDILAGGYASRINMNLREAKGWTYGAYGKFEPRAYGSRYVFEGTIQQDKVGAAIAEIRKDLKDVLGDRPVSAGEVERFKVAALGKSALAFKTRNDYLLTLGKLRELGRPDDYPGKTSERLRAVTLSDVDAVLRAHLAPDRWIWGIVGDAAIIRPQLDGLGIPVTVMKASEVLPPS